jgi:hypothetical protein
MRSRVKPGMTFFVPRDDVGIPQNDVYIIVIPALSRNLVNIDEIPGQARDDVNIPGMTLIFQG